MTKNLAELLNRLPDDAEIIAIDSSADGGAVSLGLTAAGLKAMLPKPFNQAALENAISNIIGFTFEPGELQTVNASDLIRLGTALAEFRLPLGHTIIEAAEGWCAMIHQTVRIDATGDEYERIVHQDEAYGSEPAGQSNG